MMVFGLVFGLWLVYLSRIFCLKFRLWKIKIFQKPKTKNQRPSEDFMTDKKKSFESSLNDLEKIVRKLEDGDLSLEESLKLFEDGVKLSRECRERLTNAERRIEVLLERLERRNYTPKSRCRNSP